MRKKLMSIIGLGLICLISGCTKKEEMKYIEQSDSYHNDAYNTYKGKTKHLENYTASFYIGCSGEYYEASKFVIEVVQKFTALNISINDNPNSYFSFSIYDNWTTTTRNAETITPDSDKIDFGYIKYNIHLMDSKSISKKRGIALHEMGHILGLKDISDENLRGYTVMFPGTYFLDYTDLDKENIIWFYGGTYNK